LKTKHSKQKNKIHTFTHLQTCICRNIHVHIWITQNTQNTHTYIQQKHTTHNTYTNTHKHISHVQTRTNTPYTNKHIYIHKHTHECIQHTHKYKHTHKHTHIHTYTHTQPTHPTSATIKCKRAHNTRHNSQKYMYLYICVCLCVCLYLCVCVCVCIICVRLCFCFFVVPVLVMDGVGPVLAIKLSLKTLKDTWGEALIGKFSLGMLSFLIMLPFLIIVGVLLAMAFASGNLVNIILAATLGVAVIIVVCAFNSAADVIFKALLYNYATGRSVPSNIDTSNFSSAFAHKD